MTAAAATRTAAADGAGWREAIEGMEGGEGEACSQGIGRGDGERERCGGGSFVQAGFGAGALIRHDRAWMVGGSFVQAGFGPGWDGWASRGGGRGADSRRSGARRAEDGGRRAERACWNETGFGL